MSVPRVAPVRREAVAPELQQLLRHVPASADGEPLRVFATLAHHPSLLSAWLPFGSQLLLEGRLSARDRELLVLRTSWLCAAEYEWGHHVPLGQLAGLTEDEIARIPAGPADERWSSDDVLLLTATDELHATARVSDTTWTGLAQRFGPAELIELVMLIGQYHMVAFALNSLGVQLEPGFAGFPRQ